MARRKPQRVERNRQQNARQRVQASGSVDSADEDASNEPSYAVIVDDSSAEDASDDGDVEADAAPPAKRPRFRSFPRMIRRSGPSDGSVELRVGEPSRLSAAHAPWTEARRTGALWVRVPVDAGTPLGDKLHAMEEKGTFSGCDSVQRVGFVVSECEDDEASADPTVLPLHRLCEGWGRFIDRLLEHDLVTMEVTRIVSDDGDSVAYEWEIGVDWCGHMAEPNGGIEGLMTWLLYRSKNIGEQWSYPYPKEIDALYDMTHKWKPDEEVSFDVHDVYSKIDVKRQLARDVSNIPAHMTSTDSALLPTLRDYQKAALSWMLEREGVQSHQVDQGGSIQVDKPLACLTTCVRFPWPSTSASMSLQRPSGSEELLYDIFSHSFRLTSGIDENEALQTELDAVRGGILADEMGLGKTVEVIALVLSNPSAQTLPVVVTDVSPPEDEIEEMDAVYACICGSEDDCDLGWVMCDLCKTWHHRLCTGFDPDGARTFTVSPKSALTPDSFACFNCQVEHHVMLTCKTTLIVSPESIHDQWESELKRHVQPGALKLMRYPGVKALRSRLQGKGPSAEWRVLGSFGLEMASFDIVLTTYEALASDLHHIPTSVGKQRRSSTRQKRKKYAFIGSPLVFLHFWRVCMDEAQVGVENTQLQAALTVAELNTEIKWIVTGTPFSTQLMDLYGCFAFLRVAPYCDEAWGKRMFQAQVENLFERGATDRVFDLLLWDGRHSRRGGGLLWRTNKNDVLQQLGLPPQSEEIVWCRFSNVERLFYDKQEAEVIKAVQQEQERRRKEVGDGYDEEEQVGENVWHRVLLLRQVCCHPQVGQILRSIGATKRSGRPRRARGTQNASRLDPARDEDRVGMSVLTMDDFLIQLLDRCRRECEEAQRKLISAHNGHASLALIEDDFATAITKYMISIQLIRSNWEDFRADLLPRLHIVENLAATARRAFKLSSQTDGEAQHCGDVDSTGEAHGMVINLDDEQNRDSSSFNGQHEENPKTASLMPELPVLLRTITPDGLVTEGVDFQGIARECKELERAAHLIRRFYLTEAEYKHSVALHQFDSTLATMQPSLYQPTPRGQAARDAVSDGMLCSSNVWWLEMFEFLKQLPTSGQAHVLHMVHRLRAHLYALGTTFATSFAERFHDVHGLTLVLMSELSTLFKKREAIVTKLLSQSQSSPTKEEIETSGNCKKCRDTGDGPICWHCKFYKELEGYKLHILGIDNTVVTAAGLAPWTANLLADEGGDVEATDETSSNSTSTTASTSLILDIFRQVSSSARLLVRQHRSSYSATEVKRLTELFQDGVQQETELWANVLREWNQAKKLFQAQHQRLGSLDELEMARMKIRLRLPGEVVMTATDKLYKLSPHELPVKAMSLDAERVVAEEELKQKKSELRYLKHLQATKPDDNAVAGEVDNAAEDTNGGKICVVCLEDISKQRVAMLPCAHKTCIPCSDRLARLLRPSHSIRCPTCRRVFAVEERKEVENDADRAKEFALAARIANPRVTIADVDVPLIRSGFSSKIDAILRRVRALATANPELKALVFTQWQDMMGVIAAALQLNGVKCFTYTTKKQFHRVLHDFKLFPDACVLALPFKIGANGLNIIEATEVLLVEPLLNASIEAQAINRVHRIGQTKPTRVHRFLVDNSVEERIHWLGRDQRKRVDTTTTLDGEEVGEDEDEDMHHDDSVVVGRQETEKLSLAQLQALLNGRAMISSSGTDVANGALTSSACDHPFWQQLVEMNGRVMTRREARELLERRRAAENRASPSTGDNAEPVTMLVDRNVSLSVAHELLQLSMSEDDSTRIEGMNELLTMAQQRVREEHRIWRAKTATT